LVEGLTEFSETWPRSGMMRNGIAYQLPPLVPLTDETASGLWPTPTSQDNDQVAGIIGRRKGNGGAAKRDALGRVTKDVADAERRRLQGGLSNAPGRQQSSLPRIGRHCGGSEFGAPWWAEPDVGRVAYGVPDGMDRIEGLGNAVVPQIPEIIG
jgi:hypothetical protein